MPDEKLIEKAWREYLDHVYDGRLPEVELPSIRLAFYAGATALFCEIGCMSSGEAEEMAVVERLDSIRAELLDWNDEIEQIMDASERRPEGESAVRRTKPTRRPRFDI
jgi:hypothetical protein